MKHEIKKSSLAILVMQRNLLFCLCFFLLVTTLCLTIAITRTQSITLFKSPESKLELPLAKSQGEFLAHLILNRSLSNSQEQNEILFPWVDPAFLFSLKQGLEEQKEEMERNFTTFEWNLLDSTIEKLEHTHVRVFLKGTLSVYLPINQGKKQLIQEEKNSYILDLKLKNGKLLLTHFRKDKSHV